MARRGLKKNVSNEARADALISVLSLNAPNVLSDTLEALDYRDIKRLPPGPAREEKFGELVKALEPLAKKHAPPSMAPSVRKAVRGRGKVKATAAAQARAQRQAPRARMSRRGAGAGAQVSEFTENVIISRGYRGYSFEVEEILPGKWEATITYEPIIAMAGGPTAKGESFPVTGDPDLLIAKVKSKIDETLSWYAERGIEPGRSKKKKTERRATRRQRSRRGARREAEQAEAEAEEFAGRAASAGHFAKSYAQYGYDPTAPRSVNIRNMQSKISELRDELRVTRDQYAKRELQEIVDTANSMLRRLKSGKSAFAKTRGSKWVEEGAEPSEADVAWKHAREWEKKNPGKKPRRLTKKQLAELPNSAFALPSKRLFPVHKLQYVRVAMLDIESAAKNGKITDAERNRAMKKAEKVMSEAIDRAVGLEGNPLCLPCNPKKNPIFGRSDPAADAGREWEKEYEKQLRKWMRSINRRNPDFVALIEAYDAIELARANYFLADDEKKSEDMARNKRELRENIVEMLEHAGQPAAREMPQEAEFTEVKKPKSRSRRASASKSGTYEAVDNPTAKRHGKTGRDYLKKADAYWDKYYKRGRATDLIDAFKYLSLAHEELKYAGDKEKLKEAKAGLKAATAELKLGLG